MGIFTGSLLLISTGAGPLSTGATAGDGAADVVVVVADCPVSLLVAVD